MPGKCAAAVQTSRRGTALADPRRVDCRQAFPPIASGQQPELVAALDDSVLRRLMAATFNFRDRTPAETLHAVSLNCCTDTTPLEWLLALAQSVTQRIEHEGMGRYERALGAGW